MYVVVVVDIAVVVVVADATIIVVAFEIVVAKSVARAALGKIRLTSQNVPM